MSELKNVKVGDKLLVRNSYGEGIETVERITKTLVFTRYRAYRIKDGYSTSSDKWNYIHAGIATQEDINRIMKANIRRNNIKFCKNTDFEELTDSQLERIINIINDKN